MNNISTQNILQGIKNAYLVRTKLPRKLKKAFKKIRTLKQVNETSKGIEFIIIFSRSRQGLKAKRLFMYSFEGLIKNLKEKLAENKQKV